MKFISDNEIEIDKELSELDKFTLDFLKILKKHTPYVIISGYVSILLGRARSSEDVDLLTPVMPLDRFTMLFNELTGSGFYCLNAETPSDAYEYLKDKIAIRMAKLGCVIPNMELKFAKNQIDTLSLRQILKVKLNGEEVIISSLEMQIAFKEKVLKSPKDIEDARHIRNVAKDHLNYGLIEVYGEKLNEIY